MPAPRALSADPREAARAATRHPYGALLLLCLLLWLPGFFTIPPSDRDESRFVQGTKQMLESGNYVEIRNGAEARNRKPIGIYWLQVPFAAAARATGLAAANPVWPYRLPSFLGGLLAVFATFGLWRRTLGDRVALLAAATLASCVILTVEAHLAKTDAALLGVTTCAMGLLARAYLRGRPLLPEQAVAFWLALGAGILLKGPVTPMVVGLTTLGLAAADRRRGGAGWLRGLRSGWGVPLMLLIVLPWFIAIGLATHGAFFADALGGDLASKVRGGDDAHGALPGLHLLLLPVLAFPSSLLLVRALPAAWRDRTAPPTRFLLAWIVPSWIVFECVPTKLPHYTLPLFPALCLLGAAWALDPVRRPAPRWLEMASAALFAVAAAILGGGAALLPEVVRPGWAASDAIGLPALAAAALLGWLVLRALPDPRRALGAGLLALPLLLWSVLGLELPDLRGLWLAPQVAAALQAHWSGGRPDDAAFAEIGYAEPSLVFLCGTATGLLGDPEAAAHFLAGGPDRVLLVGERDLAAFGAASRRLGLSPHAFAVIRGYNYSRGRRVVLTLFDAPRSAG
ncbi:MAG: phospholipid carrier-dependent glycosyltransferase [Acidisphaera sp.]|nr:phospholipid carrier-dependent glycosyltransferase [Acidisphaera sp.]